MPVASAGLSNPCLEQCLCLRNFRCCRYGNRLVHHIAERHGNLTWVRDVVLVSLLLALGGSYSLRFNDYVLMILLWIWRIQSFRHSSRSITCTRSPSLNRSGWLVWRLCKAPLRLSLSPSFLWHCSCFSHKQDHRLELNASLLSRCVQFGFFLLPIYVWLCADRFSTFLTILPATYIQVLWYAFVVFGLSVRSLAHLAQSTVTRPPASRKYLFNIHDHGRLRLNWAVPNSAPSPYVCLTVHGAVSLLVFGEYDRPVTQSTATPETSLRTIPTLDRVTHSLRPWKCHHTWEPTVLSRARATAHSAEYWPFSLILPVPPARHHFGWTQRSRCRWRLSFPVPRVGHLPFLAGSPVLPPCADQTVPRQDVYSPFFQWKGWWHSTRVRDLAGSNPHQKKPHVSFTWIFVEHLESCPHRCRIQAVTWLHQYSKNHRWLSHEVQ